MRITTNMMYDRNLTSLMKNSERLSKALDQMNTLEKFSTAGESPNGMAQKLMHIPVENEHLFRFKMNADSGLRVHHFRTPQSTNSDVR